MNKVYSVVLILFMISTNCLSQQGKDSSISVINQSEKSIIPMESFRLFTNPLFFRMNNIGINGNYLYSNTFIPLGLVSNKEYLIQLNKKEFLKQISSNYQLSKPGTFQQILGMVQMGAAAALAGYHIYKYEIKKEKK